MKAYNQDLISDDENDYTRPIPQYVEGQSLSMIYAVRSLGIDTQTGKEIYVKGTAALTYTQRCSDLVPIAECSSESRGFSR